MICETDRITSLKGIGTKKSQAFESMGIKTVKDLVCFFPCSYKDRGVFSKGDALTENARMLIKAVYVKSSNVSYFHKKSKVTLTFEDEKTLIRCVYFNQPYMKSNLKPGAKYILYGLCLKDNSGLYLLNPQCERSESALYLKEGLYPIYPIPYGSPAKHKQFQLAALSALENCVFTDDTPEWIKKDLGFEDINKALLKIHAPEDIAETKKALELFKLREFLALRALFDKSKSGRERAFPLRGDIAPYLASLNFELTEPQKKALGEILTDIASDTKMNRLLQGDVGSGKTAVAQGAAFVAAKSGAQAVMTAPTEILARQHYERYKNIFLSNGIKPALLTASMKKSEKTEALLSIKSGEAGVIFGTHSVFSKDVEYKKLALVIIDEQQRYGVAQRAALEGKGASVHVLVMSATPIPRTLSLSLYKDLSISVIDALPFDRRNVKSYTVNSSQNEKIYAAIRRAAEKNLKSFIVCPAIDSEDMENVNSTYEEAEKRLAPYKAAALTALTSEEKKREIMDRFAYKDICTVIATSVIEVGIDVKGACLIWIKGSERFGLSQLHQLRGRVGRAGEEAVCFFHTDSTNEKVIKRLAMLCDTKDGFEVAKLDLKIRGAGELFGYRQSGKSGNVLQDGMD